MERLPRHALAIRGPMMEGGASDGGAEMWWLAAAIMFAIVMFAGAVMVVSRRARG